MRVRKGYNPVKMTTHEQDKALVIRAIEGDQKAYNDLLKKYKPILYTAAKRRLPNKPVEDLEDIVMIVLGQSFVRIHQYDPTKSLFFTWMVACLHNYVNGIPSQKKRIQADSLDTMYTSSNDDLPVEYEIPDQDQFDKNYDLEQSAKLIRLLIERLPSELARVVTLRYFRELTYKEIAEIIGCKESEIYSKLNTARKKLKKMSEFNQLF